MSRGRTTEELAELKAQATEMRLAGIGAKRIAKELRISASTVSELLADVPVASGLTRPNARDVTRAVAEAMRADGRTYQEIADELGVSKGLLSGWLAALPFPTEEQREAVRVGTEVEVEEALGPKSTARVLRCAGFLVREIADELGVSAKTAYLWTVDLPVPPQAVHGRSAEETRAMGRAYWDARLAAEDREREMFVHSVAERVPVVSDELLELLAAVVYWCEGGKRKPWNRAEQVTLINSDPDVIRLWCEWLHRRGIPPERIRLRLSIHESADVARATEYWAAVVGREPREFMRPTLKRHNPKTVRRNVGASYHGCLIVGVLQCRELYREIEGLWRGLVRRSVDEARVQD
jgi:transposase